MIFKDSLRTGIFGKIILKYTNRKKYDIMHEVSKKENGSVGR